MARPDHKPTVASRRRVEIAAGAGMPHEGIAQALKIDAKTLRKHYAVELASGANVKRMQVLESLFAQARKGSTSAARAYLAHVPKFDVLPVAGSGAEGAPVPKPEKLGKKQQAQLDAVGAEAGSGWDGLLPKNVTPIRQAG